MASGDATPEELDWVARQEASLKDASEKGNKEMGECMQYRQYGSSMIQALCPVLVRCALCLCLCPEQCGACVGDL